MAGRNKKKSQAGVVPAKFAVTLVVLSIISLCYLWLRGRCETLGRDLKDLEVRKAALQRAYLNAEYRWSNFKSPSNIDRALKAQGLVMGWPGKDQVVRLSEQNAVRREYALSLGRGRSAAPPAAAEGIVMND